MKNLDIDDINWKPSYTQVLLMTQNGDSLSGIVEATGLTITKVKNVRSSTYFLQKLASLNTKVIEKVIEHRSLSIATDEAREIITKAAVTAARKVVQLAHDGDNMDRLQLLACQDILDRAGLKPIEVIESRERVYSPEEVSSARAILQETEAIVARLSNNTSKFVIDRRSVTNGLVSSTTDESSDATTEGNTAEAL